MAASASTCSRQPMICSSENLWFGMPDLSLRNWTLVAFPDSDIGGRFKSGNGAGNVADRSSTIASRLLPAMS
jgi:hypothetical protein